MLELAESVSGEYCGKLLGDFGAEVIKVERPGSGSPTRAMGPLASGVEDPERSALFAYLNTNKSSVILDLAASGGLSTLARLLSRVDVVIDDHPVGWLRSVGIDPAEIEQSHPTLVLCAITPWGQEGPEVDAPAEDINIFHASGWGYHTPSASAPELPPLNGPSLMPSYEAALEAALCVSASLYERETSGLGRFIDISMQAVLASRTDYVLGQMVAGDMPVGAERTAFDLAGPAGIFPCQDGFVYIWMSAPLHWQALRQMLGEPDWMADFPEDWLEKACTPERVALCRQHLGAWLLGQRKAEVAARAQKRGLTLVAVHNARDLQACEQYAHRGFFQEVSHPLLGKALYPTVPYRMSETPAAPPSPAPLLGQHRSDLLAGDEP